MQVQKILLATDFSDCANAALDYALVLAEQYGAELYLLHVVVLHNEDPFNPAYHFPDADDISRRMQEYAAGEFQQLLAARSTGELRIFELQRRAIAAAPAIVDFAREQAVDLIVLGSHGRRGLRRLLLGSVAEEVVHTAPASVLTVRSAAGDGPRRLAHLVVPYDFSADSRRALEVAKELAALHQSRISLVHALSPPMDPQSYEPLADRRPSVAFVEIAGEVEAELARVAAEPGGPDIAYHVQVLEGSPAAAIHQYAEEAGADLIVLATHGTTGLRHFLIGSVAEKLVRISTCPVLTLRPVASGDVST